MSWDVSFEDEGGVFAQLEDMEEDFTTFEEHTVASNVHYAVYVEFGTKYMRANAGLRESVADTMDNLDSVVGDADSADEISRLIAEDIRDGWKRRVWVDTGRLKRSIHVEEA